MPVDPKTITNRPAAIRGSGRCWTTQASTSGMNAIQQRGPMVLIRLQTFVKVDVSVYTGEAMTR